MSTDAFDPAGSYRLAPSISLRPEPFGALVYDFTTRRLSFLKTKQLVAVVEGLAAAPDAAAAVAAAGVAETERPSYLKALAGLFQAGTIEHRPTGADEQDHR
ncbi:mycofactocin biosynthesis chaperone MftB [Nocardia nova]|uniref:mycofactocin biosynthesis chaperone MftB n=1 Tax=Nocardia nova TaxID=37330 RepID=UPI001ED99EED|nr:mycofactocin biosynthesis chaperone MftB [Nocardia nova]